MSKFLSATAFRLQFVLHMLIYALGLFAPWDRILPTTSKLSTWLFLAAEAGRQGWGFTAATVAVLAIAATLALLAAGLRTWAAAWGEHGAVGGEMQAAELVAGGPYRWLRHPMYVGIFLHTLALAILMPPTGAIFAVTTTVLLDIWLVRSEDRYLLGRLGEAYATYRRERPALLPQFRPFLEGKVRTRNEAAWGIAAVSEIYFWGVAMSFATLGWRYNAFLIERGVVVAFGVALVARALLPKQAPAI